ncbi:Basal cell adhesion molecule [Gryllus bimaculatus]|nr:Basal cell adhesion molecule [Gryllus bimaculatus]
MGRRAAGAATGAGGAGGAGRRLTLDVLEVPAVVDVREDATLRCHFDVGSERLYSVKWYKDEFEFYRFMPDNMPPSQVFPVPGVTLKVSLLRCLRTPSTAD